MAEEKYGITIMNELEKNVLEIALDHMQEHLEGIIDFHEYQGQWNHNTMTHLLEKLEACKNLKKDLAIPFKNPSN